MRVPFSQSERLEVPLERINAHLKSPDAPVQLDGQQAFYPSLIGSMSRSTYGVEGWVVNFPKGIGELSYQARLDQEPRTVEELQSQGRLAVLEAKLPRAIGGRLMGRLMPQPTAIPARLRYRA